jgi:aminoglycoside phosphotransferase (APT) family kinase protein
LKIEAAIEGKVYTIVIGEQAIKWVERAIEGNARVIASERLMGGVSTPIYRVTAESAGVKRVYVLRQYDNEDWLRGEPDLARHEAECLRRASGMAGVPAPSVIAYDMDGSESGGLPSLLMTHLEGKVVLEPANLSRWLDRLAAALAKLHGGEAGGNAARSEGFPWTFGPYSDAGKFDASGWSAVPDQWRRAIQIVTGSKPFYEPRFIHRDYHPTNILWSDGEISGIVDWVNGCIGPAGIDVGHCRVNLCQLHGVDAADEFLERYRTHAGASFQYDPYWDLLTLLDYADGTPEVYQGWIDLGFARLTDELVQERLDAYLTSVLGRVSSS